MPLPQSVTCSACRHTYPDGWKRCPYCGFDPIQAKRDAEIARQARAAAPQRSRPEQPRGGKGQPRLTGQGRGRGQESPRQERPQQNRSAGRPAPQRAADRGPGPRQPGNAQSQRPGGVPAVENSIQKTAQGGDQPRRSRRSRRRGRRSGPQGEAGAATTAQPALPRVDSPNPGARPPEGPVGGEPRKSRKRFRRRRRGGENKGPAGPPPGPATT